jgi:hypothetical protein
MEKDYLYFRKWVTKEEILNELPEALERKGDEHHAECDMANKLGKDEFLVKAVHTNEHGEQELKF